jgi:hypothetical protein
MLHRPGLLLLICFPNTKSLVTLSVTHRPHTEIGKEYGDQSVLANGEDANLAGSPHSVEMYYEVDSVPDTAKVIHHLRDTVKFLDPNTVLVEKTDSDASELYPGNGCQALLL